jgi:putative hydrolase of the HAD superfamily
MRALKAITLDLVGTLLTPYPSVGAVYADAARKCGLNIPAQMINEHFPAAFKSVSAKLKPEAFWKEVVVRTLGENLPYEKRDEVVEKCWTAFASAKSWRLAPGSISSLTALRFLGLKVCVLSNTDARIHGVLRELDLLKFIDAVFLADEIGYRKPDARAFQHVSRTLQIPINQLAHIGDNPDEDGIGARDAGVLGIVVGGRHAPENCLRAEKLEEIPYVVRAVLTEGKKKGRFSRNVINLLANLRGLPEDKGRSTLRNSVSIDDAVTQAFRKLRLDKPVPEDAIVASWNKLLPLKLSRRCAPLRVIEDGRLIIQCESAVIKSEARFFEKSLLLKIRELPGCRQVKAISWVTA